MEAVRTDSIDVVCIDHGAQGPWEEMNLRGESDLFNNGQWSELVNDVVAQQCRESQANQYVQEDEQVKRGMAAQSKIQRGQVSTKLVKH